MHFSLSTSAIFLTITLGLTATPSTDVVPAGATSSASFLGDGGPTGDCVIVGPSTICALDLVNFSSFYSGTNYVWSLPVNNAGASFCGANGQQSICVTTAQAGSFTLQLNYVLNGIPRQCVREISVDPALVLGELDKQEACEGDDVTFKATVLSGNGPHTFTWTFDDGTGPVLITGANTSQLVLNDVAIADSGTYCVQVSETCGSEEACGSLTVTDCGGGEEFCTLTQGAYGSAGGAGNLEMLTDLLATDLVVGKTGRSLRIPAGAASAQCIIDRLPANSGPAALPDFGNETLDTGCNTAPTGLPLKNGRFKNVLLGQTITLSLNVRLDSGLLGVDLCSSMSTEDSGGSVLTKTIPQDVLTVLGGPGLTQDVAGLLELANRALAAQPTGVASLSEINEAVDAINNLFDECRTLIDCGE